MNNEALSEAAEFFYETCELWEDEDLDPEDHIEVLRRAFRSSDCDDFAAVLARMTGWDVVTMSWQIPDWGMGHHALVKNPEGRLLDVGGWTDEAKLKKYFGLKKSTAVKWADGHLSSPLYDEETITLMENTVRNLPFEPFSDPAFQASLVTTPLDCDI
jgi:hypothetical protein